MSPRRSAVVPAPPVRGCSRSAAPGRPVRCRSMADAPDTAPDTPAPNTQAPDTRPDARAPDDSDPALRHHGDAEIAPGLLDFAVNVQGDAPPRWLRDRLVAALDDLARYPTAAAYTRARAAVAAGHGRRPDEVLVLAGSAEGFALLPALRPRLAAIVHPGFTEPEAAP